MFRLRRRGKTHRPKSLWEIRADVGAWFEFHWGWIGRPIRRAVRRFRRLWRFLSHLAGWRKGRYRKPSLWLRIVLYGTSVSMLLFWIPVARGLVSDEYAWGNQMLGVILVGRGTDGRITRPISGGIAKSTEFWQKPDTPNGRNIVGMVCPDFAAERRKTRKVL